jgi:hypothetical protein
MRKASLISSQAHVYCMRHAKPGMVGNITLLAVHYFPQIEHKRVGCLLTQLSDAERDSVGGFVQGLDGLSRWESARSLHMHLRHGTEWLHLALRYAGYTSKQVERNIGELTNQPIPVLCRLTPTDANRC